MDNTRVRSVIISTCNDHRTFRTTVFPAARQGPSFQAVICNGKFQGTEAAIEVNCTLVVNKAQIGLTNKANNTERLMSSVANIVARNVNSLTVNFISPAL